MTKQSLAKITESAEQASASAREAPVMKSSALNWQLEGYAWREAFVRLPDGAIVQDLQDVPTIWKNIQSAPSKALRKYDRVTAVAFDESWLVKDAIVVEADNQRVVLAIKDIVRMTMKTAEWRDERHIVRWDGDGFAVFRTSDGVRMIPASFGNIEAAKSVMFAQFYTKKVA